MRLKYHHIPLHIYLQDSYIHRKLIYIYVHGIHAEIIQIQVLYMQHCALFCYFDTICATNVKLLIIYRNWLFCYYCLISEIKYILSCLELNVRWILYFPSTVCETSAKRCCKIFTNIANEMFARVNENVSDYSRWI